MREYTDITRLEEELLFGNDAEPYEIMEEAFLAGEDELFFTDTHARIFRDINDCCFIGDKKKLLHEYAKMFEEYQEFKREDPDFEA